MGTTVRKTSIIDLPSELLSIIFNFAHKDTIPIRLERDIIPTWMRMEGPEGFQQSVSALVRPNIPEELNLKSPALFPYSLAAVCSFWRDILCSHPEFWTLVVLFIDSKPTSLVETSLFLKWSQRHHIDVFITRRDELRSTYYPDLHEKCQIAAFLYLLKPHLGRCRSLHIDAHLSTSFPIIHKIFDEIAAPYLEFMELVCDTHAFADYEYDSDWDDGNDFDPDLTQVVIDGTNFRVTSGNLDNWLSRCIRLSQITIAHYKPGDNNNYCFESFLDSIDSLPYLDQLKLEDLHFSISPDNTPDIFLTTPYVHLVDVSESFIGDMSKFALFDTLSVLRITRCPLPALHNFDSMPITLILEDISSNVNLLDAVTAWEGENLWLDRCQSFSGAFLKVLGRRRSSGYPCLSLRRLLLYRLPKFSISSLKKMVQRRNRDVRYGDSNWKTATAFGPAISHLAVVQCGLEKLSAKDERWFRSHLVEFHWSQFSFLYIFAVTDHTKSSTLIYGGVFCVRRASIIFIHFAIVVLRVPNFLEFFYLKKFTKFALTHQLYPTYPKHHRVLCK